MTFDVARYVFGTEVEFRRRAAIDKQLQRALDLARGAKTEQDLLRKAITMAPADSVEGQ
jgi:hypothetical protein